VPTVSIAFAISLLLVMSRRRRNQGPRQRALSFNSSAMMQSTFPANVNMIDPIINGALTVAKAPTKDNVLQMLEKIKIYDRFVAVPTREREGCFMPRQELDLQAHLKWESVADGPASWKRVEEIIVSPLSIDKAIQPWWELVVVQPDNGDQTIVLFRIHHIIGDGISLIQAMNSLFTDMDGSEIEIEIPGLSSSRGRSSRPSIFTLAGRVVRDFIHCAALAKSSFDSSLAFTAQDKRRLVYTNNRKILFFPTVELSFIKKIKNSLGVTVNDIMLSAVTGAILRYCHAVGDPVIERARARATRGSSFGWRGGAAENKEEYEEMRLSGLLMRALVPVALPREPPADENEKANSLRNRWAFASVKLPVNSGTAKGRAETVNATMNAIKRSLVIPIQLWLQDRVLANSPRFFFNNTCLDIFKRHSMVFSNVPGPSFPVFLAGERVTGIQMLFPNLIAQVGILSYDGQVAFNMILDDDVVTKPGMLRDCYVEELRDLAEAADLHFPESIAQRALKPAGLGLLAGEAL